MLGAVMQGGCINFMGQRGTFSLGNSVMVANYNLPRVELLAADSLVAISGYPVSIAGEVSIQPVQAQGCVQLDLNDITTLYVSLNLCNVH